jgi:hypothetical protein
MARVARAIPAALAFLLMAAHYLRAGHLASSALCVVAAGLSFVRRPWIVAALRLGLAAGSVLWVLTAWRIAQSRMEAGSPYVRILVILGAVATFTAFSAWLLPSAGSPGDDD